MITASLGPVRAQAPAGPQPPATQDEGQPSDRGVARISVMAGEVSVQRGDSGEVSAAAVNAPLVVGDLVRTGPGGRAEIQFDSANMARLASDSEVRLSELAPGRYQLQVARGTLMFSVVRDSHAQAEISTPSVSVRPAQRGAYRITVLDDGQVEITTRSGQADIYTPRGIEKLPSGNTMMVRGSAADPEFQMVRAIQEDDFDHWNASRDQALSRSRSYQYVSPEINGAEDLDANGRWVDSPDYGRVWSPNVGPEWAPYHNGRWVWTDFYGWTWVDNDPWGWAPFHYGRWFNSGLNGWCWYPGPYYGRHYWSPALVAFFGFGGFHVGVGFGGPGFGWVALAPFERVHRWWGGGYYGGFRNHNALVNNIRVENNVNITNTYRNARFRNGVTAVNAHDFANGRSGNFMHLSGDQLRQASLVRGQVPIAPTAQSQRFSDRAVSPAMRSAAANNTRFFSRNPAPQVNRVPFAEQQRSLEQVSRAGAGSVARADTRASAPVASRNNASGNMSAHNAAPNSTAATNTARSDTGAWRRFGEPSRSSGAQPQQATPHQQAAAPAARGWQSSGDRPSISSGGASSSGRAAAPGGVQRSQSAPSDGWRRFQPSTSASNSGGRSQVQIAPPIVRERGTTGYRPSYQPRYSGSPAGGSYNSGGRSVPRAEPAPRGGGNYGGGSRSTHTDSAPRSGGGGHSSSGGGGGSSHSSSGGGGGHSSSGGHHR